MEKNSQTPSDSQDAEKSHGLTNIVRTVILVAVLVGAWFLMDWLMNGK